MHEATMSERDTADERREAAMQAWQTREMADDQRLADFEDGYRAGAAAKQAEIAERLMDESLAPNSPLSLGTRIILEGAALAIEDGNQQLIHMGVEGTPEWSEAVR